MKRVVLDTSVVAAALRSRHGASNKLLRLVALRRMPALVTTALFIEYEAVLRRPEQRLASGLNMEQVDRVLAILASALEPVEVHFQWRPQLADAGDEMVLEAAINGRADALVTHNVKDFARAGERFRLEVLRPAELLKRIQA